MSPSHVPSSAIAAFIEPAKIDALLTALIPDSEDRAFVTRLVIGEGPAHHRGANYVLLALLGRALEARGLTAEPSNGPHVSVPMRIPPHLADPAAPKAYALSLPTAPLEALAGGDPTKLAAMIDCVTDGPPQHALANVAMIALISSLLTVPA